MHISASCQSLPVKVQSFEQPVLILPQFALCYSLTVRHKSSHPHKAARKITMSEA